MTKKDYVLIAERLKATRNTYGTVVRETGSISPREVVDDVALALSEVFQNDNPRFNKQRFLDACGCNINLSR